MFPFPQAIAEEKASCARQIEACKMSYEAAIAEHAARAALREEKAQLDVETARREVTQLQEDIERSNTQRLGSEKEASGLLDKVEFANAERGVFEVALKEAQETLQREKAAAVAREALTLTSTLTLTLTAR